MTLGFMKSFPWKVDKQPVPTYFREKILAGVDRIPVDFYDTQQSKSMPYENDTLVPKKHTIRLDPHNRWKAGRKIEMVYRGSGYRIIDHFNKDIPELEKCVSVQRIKIKWDIINVNDIPKKVPFIVIDGALFDPGVDGKEYERFALNDGLTWEQFCRWFKSDFEGNIIHFTSLRY